MSGIDAMRPIVQSLVFVEDFIHFGTAWIERFVIMKTITKTITKAHLLFAEVVSTNILCAKNLPGIDSWLGTTAENRSTPARTHSHQTFARYGPYDTVKNLNKRTKITKYEHIFMACRKQTERSPLFERSAATNIHFGNFFIQLAYTTS